MREHKDRSVTKALPTIGTLTLASLLLVAGEHVSASAADLGLIDTLKQAATSGAPLTWNGITLYGNIDVAAQYETHGVPLSAGGYSAPTQLLPMSRRSMFLLAPNQEQLSALGLTVDEPLGFNTRFIGKLEMNFVPTDGSLDDLPRTLRAANGVPTAQQNAAADGARAGQFFGGEAYGGLTNSDYGTLKIGRQFSVPVDVAAKYDPLLSYGFSMLGYFPSVTGIGSSQTAIINDAVKYQNKIGMFTVEVLYASPEDSLKDTIQGRLGFQYSGLSVDGIAGHIRDGVSASSLSGAANFGSNFLGAKVSDANIWGIFGQYKFDLGGQIGSSDQGAMYKAPAAVAFSPSLIISGGYVNVRQMNPADGGWSAGHVVIGGNVLGPVVTTTGLASLGIVNNGFTGGDRIAETAFGTVKYQWAPEWSIAGGIYIQHQNSWGFGVPNPVFYSPRPCSTAQFVNCSGYAAVESFRIDYDWTKNFRVYVGATYTALHGGTQAGFLSTTNFAPMVGMRYHF